MRSRRWALAVVVLAASAAAADEGAYLTLLGMGRAAQVDRGPDPGPAPADSAVRIPRDAVVCSKEPRAAAAPEFIVAAPPPVDARASFSDAPRRRRWALKASAFAGTNRASAALLPPDVSTSTALSATAGSLPAFSPLPAAR
jgi:hypothetical protein